MKLIKNAAKRINLRFHRRQIFCRMEKDKRTCSVNRNEKVRIQKMLRPRSIIKIAPQSTHFAYYQCNKVGQQISCQMGSRITSAKFLCPQQKAQTAVCGSNYVNSVHFWRYG